MGIAQVKPLNTIFPDLPRESPMVDKDGKAAEIWLRYFDQLTLTLQAYFKNEGFVIPQLPAMGTNSIAELGNTNESIANIIYDNTNQEFKGIVLVTPGTPTTAPVTMTKTFTLT